MRAGREETIEKARETFEDALNRVLPAAKSVVEQQRRMGSEPNEIKVTFGNNLSTQAGAFIASAKAAANFGVTVRWSGASNETAPAEGSK